MIQISLWNIIFTVVNLLILFVALRFVFFKPIKKIIEQRQAEANEMLDSAKNKEDEAELLKENYENKLADAETEKKQILADARKSAEVEHNRIIEAANDKASQIHSDAVSGAKKEHDEIVDKAKKEIADLVVDATAKMTAANSSDDVNRELYDKFISEAGDEA